jgi:hypothetical protein
MYTHTHTHYIERSKEVRSWAGSADWLGRRSRPPPTPANTRPVSIPPSDSRNCCGQESTNPGFPAPNFGTISFVDPHPPLLCWTYLQQWVYIAPDFNYIIKYQNHLYF